jgi:MFS family permease
MAAAPMVSVKRQIVLAAYWFGIEFLWGSFLALVLPFILVPENGSGTPLVPASQKNTALAALEGLGLVVALVIQPAAGAWSDRLRTRWGRRRPLMVVGTAGGVLSLLLIAAAPTVWWLVGAYVLLQLGMNVSQGGYQGLLPDTVSSAQRGDASGWMAVATLGGQVAGTAVGGFVSPRVACVPIAIVVGVTALITVVGVPERQRPALEVVQRTARGLRRSAASLRGYLAEFAAYPDFCWVVLSRFCAYTGLACIQRFAANYLRDNFDSYRLFGVLDLGRAQAATGILFSVVILFGLAATYPAVRISERTGRRPVIIAASLLGGLGTLLFTFASSLTVVVIEAIPVGIAFGMLVSVDWAYMADLAPKQRSGKFLGFSNIAVAGSQAFAPFLLAPVIDAVDNSTHSTLGYRVMFLTATVFFVLGAVVLSRVRVHRIEDEETLAPLALRLAGTR